MRQVNLFLGAQAIKTQPALGQQQQHNRKLLSRDGTETGASGYWSNDLPIKGNKEQPQ